VFVGHVADCSKFVGQQCQSFCVQSCCTVQLAFLWGWLWLFVTYWFNLLSVASQVTGLVPCCLRPVNCLSDRLRRMGFASKSFIHLTSPSGPQRWERFRRKSGLKLLENFCILQMGIWYQTCGGVSLVLFRDRTWSVSGILRTRPVWHTEEEAVKDRIWNCIPLHIRQSQTYASFRRHLKTYHFLSAHLAPYRPL